MKKLFSAILLIFCCNFMIVNVHATYKDDYLELMPKVVEILKEKAFIAHIGFLNLAKHMDRLQ